MSLTYSLSSTSNLLVRGELCLLIWVANFIYSYLLLSFCIIYLDGRSWTYACNFIGVSSRASLFKSSQSDQEKTRGRRIKSAKFIRMRKRGQETSGVDLQNYCNNYLKAQLVQLLSDTMYLEIFYFAESLSQWNM